MTKLSSQSKYRISELIATISPKSTKHKSIGILLAALRMTKQDFFEIAQSLQSNDDLYFEKTQQVIIANVLKCSVSQLHTNPRYRISVIISESVNPSGTLNKIISAFNGIYSSRIAIRNKIYSMSGDRNCFTKGQLQVVAEVLNVTVEELMYESESVPQ